MIFEPLKIENRPTDWKFGDGKIAYKAVSQNWTDHIEFFENQLLEYGDTDGCVTFTAQETFDAQIDALISTFPASVVAQISSMGFMDTGNDGQPHFHSSPRFLGIQTGNKTSGNSMQEVYDVLRNYGTLPYADLPPDRALTIEEYYAPLTPAQLQKASQFLSLIGGKNAVQYHQLANGSPKDTANMITALQQAPLSIGIAVADNWNVVTPNPDPAPNAPPVHCVMVYAIQGIACDILDHYVPYEIACDILDHYVPYEKVLDAGYPINYCSQLIVSPIFPPTPQPTPIPPAPTLPPNPTTPQTLTWLQQLSAWLQSLLNTLKGR